MRILSFVPAILWFFITIVLLGLPGDDLPSTNFLDIPYLDKLVHFVMFFLLTFLFCFPLVRSTADKRFISSWCNKTVLLVIVYGVFMEFVQKDFVAGRSFDVIDIVFDSLGSFAGLIATRQFNRKKIGPDGNQGRNQN